MCLSLSVCVCLCLCLSLSFCVSIPTLRCCKYALSEELNLPKRDLLNYWKDKYGEDTKGHTPTRQGCSNLSPPVLRYR